MSTRLECEQALALLMDHLKHELPPEVAAAVQQHLDACRPCEHHARFEANFILVISQRLRRETCPAELRARVLDALQHENSAE
jgi:anti-sigma factor (TIGR02949 family)